MKDLLKVKFLILGLALVCFLACSDDDKPNVSNNGGGTSEVTFNDIDGNVYHEVKIGNQTWMKENLKTMYFVEKVHLYVN
jgi:hypothetical protein